MLCELTRKAKGQQRSEATRRQMTARVGRHEDELPHWMPQDTPQTYSLVVHSQITASAAAFVKSGAPVLLDYVEFMINNALPLITLSQ